MSNAFKAIFYPRRAITWASNASVCCLSVCSWLWRTLIV